MSQRRQAEARGKKSILREGREKGLPERHLFKAFTHISMIASAGDVRRRKEGINRMKLSLSVSTISIFLLYHSTVISINFPIPFIIYCVGNISFSLTTSRLGQCHSLWCGNCMLHKKSLYLLTINDTASHLFHNPAVKTKSI